jgi:endonuclease YncB( thermonuclease family)
VVVNSDNGNSVELAAEVQHLTDEVEDLRSEENRRYYDDRARAGSGATLSAKEPAAATVFVFRDGHRISAQSYAIAGQTLWIFNEHAARKYQIADLDASATEQVNAANGVEFHVPATKQ